MLRRVATSSLIALATLLPAGNLTIFNLRNGQFDCGSRRIVDLTGLAAIAPGSRLR